MAKLRQYRSIETTDGSRVAVFIQLNEKPLKSGGVTLVFYKRFAHEQ